MHSWSHVRTHESTHTHTHTRSKRSLWKASVFFPTHSHTPTHHHVSVLGILFSPPSPEYDMALGLHLSCIHTISLTVQDIWQTKSSGVSNVWQMKITKGPHGDLLCGTCLKKLFCFPFDIFFCQCENISFQNYFSLLLFKSLDCQWKANSLRIPNWAKEKKKISHPSLFQRHSGAHLAQPVGYFGVLCTMVWRAISGGVFSTNIPLCDGPSGVSRSKGYNPLLRVWAVGKVKKISPCFSLLIWQSL